MVETIVVTAYGIIDRGCVRRGTKIKATTKNTVATTNKTTPMRDDRRPRVATFDAVDGVLSTDCEVRLRRHRVRCERERGGGGGGDGGHASI